MTKSVTLFHYWSSVCSQKVRFALEEKGIAWESRHVDLFRFENWEPAYLKFNPRGVVPTLTYNDDVITESNVILEYLEDAFPDVPLRPIRAGDGAHMRLWLHAVDQSAHPSVVEVSFNARHRPRWAAMSDADLVVIAQRNPDPDLREEWLRRTRDGVSKQEESRYYDRLDRLCARMEDRLGESDWLAGETFSLADIALAPYVNRIEALGRSQSLSAERRPRLADWWQRVQQRGAFQRAFSLVDPNSARQARGV